MRHRAMAFSATVIGRGILPPANLGSANAHLERRAETGKRGGHPGHDQGRRLSIPQVVAPLFISPDPLRCGREHQPCREVRSVRLAWRERLVADPEPTDGRDSGKPRRVVKDASAPPRHDAATAVKTSPSDGDPRGDRPRQRRQHCPQAGHGVENAGRAHGTRAAVTSLFSQPHEP
jgi:hypothetical protein